MEHDTVIIRTARAGARGDRFSGTVELTLVNRPEGWTYAVDGVTGGDFTLTWHAGSPEQASRRLRDIYSGQEWEFTVTAADTPEDR